MNNPPPRAKVSDLIAAAGDRLTPTERRIVEVVLQDRTLLAFGTVSELAERVGTSRASIARFATKLGFEGYAHLQDHVRAGMARDLSRPSERIRHPDRSGGGARPVLEQALARVFEATGGGRIAAMARPILEARDVWILTGETSRAGAHALHSGLGMIRPGVRLIEEHSGARVLGGAGPEDVLVVFDFARYRRHAVTMAQALAERGVPVVAITDDALSPLASLATAWCGLHVPAVGPFDSSIPAVAVAELLVAYLAEELQETARDRIDRTEALWEAAGTFF
jgi:DNA-binding MurR/RpiR family transcriptional regulator